MKLNYDKLAKANSNFSKFEKEGIYILEVKDIIKDVTNAGGVKFVMSHKICNTDMSVNYDNYVITNKDGSIHPFGTGKLRAIIDATEVVIDEIDEKVLKAIMKGRKFKAYLEKGLKDYPQIRYAEIYPMSYEEAALNEEPKEKDEKDEKVVVHTEEIDTTDI